MAPISKDDVLTALPETAGAVPSVTDSRLEDTASRPQPVALEVPVTVNGARTVEGSDKREPFSETTKTVLVFGNGAVIRLGSPVSAGQLLFLTNEKTKKEVVCQVVKSKNYRNVSGYVELEFTESVVGFWGMRFPSDRIVAHATTPLVAASTPAKSGPAAPVSTASKMVGPVVVSLPKIPEVSAPQVHANLKPARAIPEPSMSPSLASSVASLLSTSGGQPGLTQSKQPASPGPSESDPVRANAAADNSSEDLKLQTARLQEQLSSLLFSATASPKPAPQAADLDAKDISGVPAKVLEMGKPESTTLESAPRPKPLPPPIKSSLDTEEVKIPSWLEPLARNAAAPASTHDLGERGKTKQSAEIASHDEHLDELTPVREGDSAPEIDLPGIGNLLPLDEEVSEQEHNSSGSRRGLWIGVIAAAVLLAAGGAWYQFHGSNGVTSSTVPASSAPSLQPNAAAATPNEERPSEHAASREEPVRPESTSGSSETSRSSSRGSGEQPTKAPDTLQTIPAARDNPRGSTATIPAAITERISRPAAAPEPKKPEIGEVHLASPTLSRPDASQDGQVAAPAISTGSQDTNSEGLGLSLAAGGGKQPAAPEVPRPVGGDVKPAKLISEVPPVYPMMARNQRVSGDVVIDALIDANGHVTTMKVISGPTLLHQAAKDSLRQWKYEPASLDGKPVAMHLSVTLRFRMP
jgi:TonB family protein